MEKPTRNISQDTLNNRSNFGYSPSVPRKSDRRNNFSYNMSCPCGSGSGEQDLLQKLREIDFAIYELALYLDAYPNSSEALAHYHSLRKTRMALIEEYQSKIGPMTIFGNTDENSWNWTESPWPWE